MKHLTILIISLTILTPFQLFSRSADFLKGKVLNSITKEPLPFASRADRAIPDGNGEHDIEKHVSALQKTLSADQVFAQLDRSLYQPRDTVYFQAYVRDRFSGTFETKSPALYVLLFNPQKTVADSARFRILESTASGWIVIPEKAIPGKYRFTAFTGDMQNYDPAEAFQLDIQVKARGNNAENIEIVFNKEQYNPKDTLVATIRISDQSGAPAGKQKFKCDLFPGNLSSESNDAMTNKFGLAIIKLMLPDSVKSRPRLKITTKKSSNEESTAKEVNIPYQDPYFELRFLPEGGTFVEGIKQKVGFNATNYKGQPEPIEGLLKDQSGVVLDTIRSGTYGPGEFSCMARPGLYVELINSSASQRKWHLPTPDKNGISLHVSQKDVHSFAIEVQSDHYTSEPLTVSCMMNATLVLKQVLTLDKKKRIIVETKELPAGVAQITLFDKNFKPLGERLIYVNADKHLIFNIQTDSVSAQESGLSISVTDNQGNPTEGIFSISVIDSLRGTKSDLFTPGIEYTMNYHPYFMSNLPAKVLARGIENMNNEDRDLIFMVYGWSRFNWNFSQEKTPAEQVDYDQLKMKVLYASKNRRSDRGLELLSLEGPSMKHLVTNSDGEISLPLDSLPEITRSITLMPVVKDKNSAHGAMLSIPYNEQYFKSGKLFIPQPAISFDEYKVHNSYQAIPMDEKTIEIPEVIVTGHRIEKRIYHDQYEESYQSANVKSLDYNSLWSSFSIEDAIRKLVNPYQMTDDFVVLSPSRSFNRGPIPALIVLDGHPLYSDGWSMVHTILPNEITSLTILTGPQGFAQYGEAAQGGVIFVNTRANNPDFLRIRTQWLQQNSRDKMLVPIEIYRPYKEFYCPTKPDSDTDSWVQNRATIYWNPEVYFNGKEPVKIKFQDKKSKRPILVILNGISYTGLLGSEKK